MRILVLGSAAGGGHPQWNCHTPSSLRVWQRAPGMLPRTQTSIAVTVNERDWILINASPDFRQQILATPALWPSQGLRHSPIKSVVITSGEIDHIAGLLSMRENQAFTLYSTPPILDVLSSNPIFDALDQGVVARTALALDVPLQLHGVTVTPFSVPGKVPLFLEGQFADHLEGTAEHTLGLCIADRQHRCFFIPGCAYFTSELQQRLQDADILFFDGTLWRDDELIGLGVSAKTGARMGHMSIDGPDGTLKLLSDLRIPKKYFLHVNTTNPILNAHSAERAKIQSCGWDVAYDGLEISLKVTPCIPVMN